MDSSRVFHYFEKICSIPHGSGNTKQLSDYCMSVAAELGLEARQDEHNNVIIIKPASVGCESAPAVMLQGHLDMVCEHEEGLNIDMASAPIELVNDGEFLSAKGTTLGGDDGIAIAAALAVLEDKTLVHPRLEAVFTVDEEIGMLGAAAIDLSGLQSKTVLNLDSEDEGVFLSGCAGGVTAKCRFPVSRKPVYGTKCTVTVDGLKGGHSGIEIDKGRANACVLLGRFLSRLDNELSYKLFSLSGGGKDNAIPSSASAELIVDGGETAALKAFAEKYNEIYAHEYAVCDSGVSLRVEVGEPEAVMAFVYSCTKRALLMLELMPNGIQSMSPYIHGLVETSLNLGIMETDFFGFTLSYSVRSNVGTKKEALCEKLAHLMDYIGGTVELTGDYPAWEFAADSPVRELICSEYEAMTGKKAKIEAIHAGVECGLIIEKLGGADVVSYGPNLFDIHTPKERLELASAKRVYELTVRVLEKLGNIK